MPIARCSSQHWVPTLLGALAMIVCYTLFYISTVFSLSYGVSTLHIPRADIPRPAVLRGGVHGARDAAVGLGQPTIRPPAGADRRLIAAILSGFTMAPLLGSGQTPLVLLFLVSSCS